MEPESFITNRIMSVFNGIISTLFGLLLLAIAVKLLLISTVLSILISLLLFILACIMMSLAFIKRGFLIESGVLKSAYFLGHYSFIKKVIETSPDNDIVLLTFNMVQTRKLGYNPAFDTTSKYISYEIHFLNKDHTNRNRIYSIQDKKRANDLCEFFSKHSGMAFYNPIEL